MGKKSPSPPPPPNPYATAQAQGAANVEAAEATAGLNQINERSPYGSVTYSGDLYNRYRDINLAPQTQRIFNTQQGIAESLGNKAQGLLGYVPQDKFSLNGLPNTQIRDFAPQDQSNIADTYFQRTSGSLNPIFQRQREDLERSLANRGISNDNELARYELDRLDQAQNEQYGKLAMDAELASGAEQSRLYGLDSDRSSRLFGMETADRARALSEQLTERTQPFNEVAAFLQGSPAIGQPTGLNPIGAQVMPADVQGAVYNSYNAAQQNYLNQQNNRQGLFGGLLGAGGTILGGMASGGTGFFSSRKFKTDLGPTEDTLERIKALPIRKWRYLEGFAPDQQEHIGPMAEDWAEAFGGEPDRIDLINYLGVAMKAIQELTEKVEALENAAR